MAAHCKGVRQVIPSRLLIQQQGQLGTSQLKIYDGMLKFLFPIHYFISALYEIVSLSILFFILYIHVAAINCPI